MSDTTTPAETERRPTAAVTPSGVNHLVLNVHSMAESHHFWCDLLGFKHVGTLRGRDGKPASMNMRFYSGVVDDVNHHDLALVERKGLAPPEDWNMMTGRTAVNHIAITYPTREAWIEQLQFLEDQGVEMGLRLDHGMTHSMYISDPNGYGVEILYDLPEEVWRHDIEGALSHAEFHPNDYLTDTTDYETDFSAYRAPDQG